MREDIYKRMAEIESTHWWFKGRKNIVGSMIAKFVKPTSANILDAGCGSGGNFNMLQKFGTIEGIEPDEFAAGLAREKNIAKKVMVGGLAYKGSEQLQKNSYDLIVMTDVLEHIEKDEQALSEAYSLLKSGGHLVLTVPAHMFLWSQHDETHYHFRRYSKKELVIKLKDAGFIIKKASYYNFFLFPPIALIRFIKAKLHIKEKSSDLSIPVAPVNTLLYNLFVGEKHLLKLFNLPTGVSLIAVCQKQD